MKFKNKIRGFLVGFSLSLVFIIFFCGMIKVDYSKEKYSGNLIKPLYYMEKYDKYYNVYLFGKAITIDNETINNISGVVQKYAILLPPKYRLFFQTIEIGKNSVNYAKDYYAEWQFQKNIS